VIPRRHRPGNANGIAQRLDVFLHDHGIRTGWNRRTGEDSGRLSLF
jgi:hypothetical protein